MWRGFEHDISYMLEYRFYKNEVEEEETPFHMCFISVCLWTHKKGVKVTCSAITTATLGGWDFSGGGRPALNFERLWVLGERTKRSWALSDLLLFTWAPLCSWRKLEHVCIGISACPLPANAPDSKGALFLVQSALEEGSRPFGGNSSILVTRSVG